MNDMNIAGRDHRPRILIISLFHPELVRGGAQQIAYELFQGLRARDDVDTVLLASIDQNYPALYKSGARITGFDGRPNEYLLLSRDYCHTWHKTSSDAIMDSLAEFLLQIAPDVVHVHHFLTIGIDVLTLIKRVLPRCRLVFTFHEFLSICAADGHLVRKTDRSLCTQASQVRCHQCFPDRAPEQFLMRKMWMQSHFAQVDAFTCPSQFMIEHFVRWGIDAGKISHVTNGQQNYATAGHLPAASASRSRFGFFGQFVDVKGVQVILRAVALLRAEGFTNFSVELNGDNLRYASPAVRDEVNAFLRAEDALPLQERIVTNNGSYEVSQLASRMSRVDWCIVPSIWWESFGLVISEAWMFGRPVICSNVGGMAERNEHDVFALQFQMGDPHALARTMRRACTETGLWDRLVGALPSPPRRDDMVRGFMAIYGVGLADDVLAEDNVSHAFPAARRKAERIKARP
jgi:glycosyltransferase involved in cell wall biosynthesis